MVILREISQREKGYLPSSLENNKREKQLSQGRGKCLGIGVDIGTTTVVVYLWDFIRGELFQSLSRENSQTRLGADVMMRMMHAQSGRREELHRMLVEQIEEMADALIELWQEREAAAVPDEEILMSVVGNPAMCHFFLDKDVTGLAGAPFESAYVGNYFCTGKEVGFRHRGQMEIMVLSGIAAHVGGDALAVLGVTEPLKKNKTKLIVDLGTNAEILLVTPEKTICCSTAAGPALEGKGIACGVRAGAGAVTGVKLAPKTGNIVLEYLSGRVPVGITGTGLLELMEGLCRSGILTREGYLLESREAEERGIHPDLVKYLVTREGQRGFLLYPGERDILLYQSDVRNIQLAKGAILAGIHCLLQSCQVSADEVEEVIVAGALGSHLREGAVIRLGLFPAAFRGKLSFIGNGAGAGAVKMLTDAGFAEGMERRAREITHVELAEREDFKDFMMAGMEFREY